MEVRRLRAGLKTDSINEREVKVEEKSATVMILMEDIEMKLFAFEAPSQLGQLQESQFNDPDPSPGPEKPHLEHPLVPLNEVVTEPVDQRNPRNTESPSPTKMENKGPPPPLMKMENVEIEMEMFPYTGMTEEDLLDRWCRDSSTPATPTPEAPHSSPTKLKWRRSMPEKRGLVVKDVVCLPSGHPRGQELSHSVPWGRERAELEALGLVTRMSIDDSWSAHEMESRLASLFKRRFSSTQGQTVSFTYLKCLQGSRVLFIPDLPPRSDWTGKQVLKITGHGPLYVLCHHDYTETKSDCVADMDQTLNSQELCLDANKYGMHDVNPRDEIRVESRSSTPTVKESFQEILEVDAVLRLFREQNMTPDVQTHLHVPRSAILSSAFTALKKPSFSFGTTPILHFVGEEDQGHEESLGEFFRLALLEVQESSLLEGQPGHLLMTYDLVALEERRYFAAGALVGWSLCHGGPGLRCLHPALYQLMCGHSPSLEDFDWREVADTDVQVQLQQLQSCGSVQKLSPSLCAWVAGCGLPEIYTAHTRELPFIYACVVEHYIYHRLDSMISQFTEGVNSCGGLWDIIKAHSEAFLPVMTNTSEPVSPSRCSRSP